MLPLSVCSHSSPLLLQLGRIERSNTLQVNVKPLNITPNGGRVWNVRKECFPGLRKTDWITIRSDKFFSRKYVHVGLENGHTLESEKEDSDSTTSQNFLWMKLKALYTFIVPYAVFGILAGGISASLLPVQTFGDLSPALFVGILKALVPAFLMIVYVAGVNHLYDVEIDKINKPYTPLASGDFSKETGIAITSAASAMSLGMAIMLSPPLFFSLLIFFLAGSAYSIDLPFLRWKKHPFLEATSMVILYTSIQIGFFTHIQKYVLGKPIAITKSLVFSTAVASFFAILFAILKDIPDVEGDKAFGVQTLSIKLGKENVFWLCVKMVLIAYGAAMVLGATSSSLPSRLITIIGHCLFATLLLFRAQSIDLTSKTSMASFYKFMWKLLVAEYFLTPFVR